MDKVLIVDGDADFLNSLKASLDKLQQFEVLTAADGKSALESLKNQNISIFVTDIQTPELDCLELLSYMTQKHPNTPCIVTTDWGKPWFRSGMAQQTFLYHLEKPFSMSAMAAAIFVGLNLRDEGLNRQGMTMASLLPLIDLQQKTCRMQITSADAGKGYLYFDKGVLFDAHYKDLNGEKAAREISTWNRISFTLSDLPRHRTRKRVKTNLMEIANAYWRKEDALDPFEQAVVEDPETEPVIPLKEETTPFEIDWEKSGAVLQTFLNDIKAIPGYLAFALVDANGKILAADQSNYKLNLRVMAQDLNPLFASAGKAASRSNIGTPGALTLHSASGVIIMQSFQMNLFIMIVCTPESDWCMMKRKLDGMTSSLSAA